MIVNNSLFLFLLLFYSNFTLSFSLPRTPFSPLPNLSVSLSLVANWRGRLAGDGEKMTTAARLLLPSAINDGRERSAIYDQQSSRSCPAAFTPWLRHRWQLIVLRHRFRHLQPAINDGGEIATLSPICDLQSALVAIFSGCFHAVIATSPAACRSPALFPSSPAVFHLLRRLVLIR